MRRAASIHRVRHQKGGALQGYIVTWDVDSADAGSCARLRRFVFGYVSDKSGKRYSYPGFVERPGVRYLGQSVLFVPQEALPAIRSFLVHERIDHVAMLVSIGAILPS